MAIDDDDKPRPKISHEIGQDLSLLSVQDIEARIGMLNTEIDWLKAATRPAPSSNRDAMATHATDPKTR